MENGTQLTLQDYAPEIFQGLNVGYSQPRVKVSQCLVNEKDSMESRDSFERYLDYWTLRKKKIDLNGLSTKTLWECCRQARDLISCGFSVKWTGGGYDIEWQLFNSRYFGVPQNRERVYTVGHFRRYGKRKIFPVTGTNGEDNLSIKQIGQLRSERNNPDKYRVYDPEGIAPTVSTGSGGGRIPFITENIHFKQPVSEAIPLDISGYEISEGEEVHCLNANDQRKVFGAKQKRTLVGVPIKEATVRGYSVAQEGDAINFSVPNSKTRRGRVGHGVAQTLDTACNQGILVNVSGEEVYAVPYNGQYIAIRRLTPRECFRLQGWEDEYFERAEMLLSDSKLYKVCGNGITVTVMEAIGTALDTLGKENPSLKV